MKKKNSNSIKSFKFVPLFFVPCSKSNRLTMFFMQTNCKLLFSFLADQLRHFILMTSSKLKKTGCCTWSRLKQTKLNCFQKYFSQYLPKPSMQRIVLQRRMRKTSTLPHLFPFFSQKLAISYFRRKYLRSGRQITVNYYSRTSANYRRHIVIFIFTLWFLASASKHFFEKQETHFCHILIQSSLIKSGKWWWW